MAEDDVGNGPAGEMGGPGLEAPPDSLLPYDRWIEQAYRRVMIRALNHAAAEGLPGAHHFYITFRTDDPDTVIPKRMLAQYPSEMTIVLQHQFWDLKVDEATHLLSVGLSFGSVPTTLVVPLRAITGFADPQVRLVLRFTAAHADDVAGIVPRPAPGAVPAGPQAALAGPAKVPDTEAEAPPPDPTPQVVSLDAFRKRGGPS